MQDWHRKPGMSRYGAGLRRANRPLRQCGTPGAFALLESSQVPIVTKSLRTCLHCSHVGCCLFFLEGAVAFRPLRNGPQSEGLQPPEAFCLRFRDAPSAASCQENYLRN